ncbi:MAG: nucleotidyltransferase domain-containing protein [Thermocladium sp.]
MGKAKSAIESQRKLLQRAREFVEDAGKEVKIEAVYVVGSRARGDYLDTSDLDLVIISDDFRGMNYIERMEKLSRYLRPGIEFFALTRDEWEGNSPYIREMRKEAKRMEELDA